MARRLLKEMFTLREMSVEIPDEHLPAVRSAINGAVRSKQLPDSVLAAFFPEKGADTGEKDKEKSAEPAKAKPDAAAAAKKPAAAKPAVNPARPTPKGPDRSMGIQPSMDASVRTWDSAAGKQKPAAPAKAAPKAEPKFDPMGTDPDYQLPSFGAAPTPPKDLTVGNDGEDDEVDYRSPFAGTDLDTSRGVGDLALGDAPKLKGPGLASRAKQSIGKIFSVDPKKKLDRTMRKMDKDAQKAAKPQGALSRLIRGKDVTR